LRILKRCPIFISKTLGFLNLINPRIVSLGYHMDIHLPSSQSLLYDGLFVTHELNSGSNRIEVLEDGCPIIFISKTFWF
jgi:hypothetical protein